MDALNCNRTKQSGWIPTQNKKNTTKSKHNDIVLRLDNLNIVKYSQFECTGFTTKQNWLLFNIMANDLIDTIIMEAKTPCNMDQWIQVFAFVCLYVISVFRSLF